MKYANYSELLRRCERIAKKKIKNYFTDFTDYDLPALKKAEGTSNNFIFIVRPYGSYLLAEPLTTDTKAIYNYYLSGGNDYYHISTKNNTITKIKF